MIKALYVSHQDPNSRTRNDNRRRADAYFVVFDAPPDAVNAQPHEWCLRFEVACGEKFTLSDFASKDAARSASNLQSTKE